LTSTKKRKGGKRARAREEGGKAGVLLWSLLIRYEKGKKKGGAVPAFQSYQEKKERGREKILAA